MMLSYYHWLELKYRIIYISISIISVSIIFFKFKFTLFSLLAEPILEEGLYFIYTDLSEPFFSWIRLSIVLSILYNIPYILYQVRAYLKSGLYKYEERKVSKLIWSFMSIWIILWVSSLKGLHIFVIPFFLDFQQESIDFCGKISEFVSLITLLSISILIVPILLIISFIYLYNNKGGREYKRLRPYVFFVSFLFSSIITPPDVISLIVMAIPIYVLFEMSYILVIISKELREATPQVKGPIVRSGTKAGTNWERS